MLRTPVTALAEVGKDSSAEARHGVALLGFALTTRWLVALLVLAGGMYASRRGLSEQDWLGLLQARALLEVVLAAVAAVGAYTFCRALPKEPAEGAGLRLLALADLMMAFGWALESPLLAPADSARLVAMTALVHAGFVAVAFGHLGRLCELRGEHGAAAWARAGAWAFLVAAVLALGAATPAAWVALGLTVPVTNPALPILVVVGLFVTLRARRALT